MAFSQATISDVRITPIATLAVIRVSWSSGSPSGTTFQVYANKDLAWHGTSTQAEFPWPAVATSYTVGTVDDGEATTDFSSSLPSLPPQGKAVLSWVGGRYEDVNLSAFNIYGESTPGGGISYATPLATVPFQIGPNTPDGFGVGGFGGGGLGYAQVSFTWTSPVVPTSGTWNYAITAINAAGNESTVTSVSVYVIRPPSPPAPDSQGRRLTYTYNSSTCKVTLNWNNTP
jgi:hypothetical protein